MLWNIVGQKIMFIQKFYKILENISWELKKRKWNYYYAIRRDLQIFVSDIMQCIILESS